MNKPHEIFLLMLNLSQIKDREDIIRLFLEAMGHLFYNSRFSFNTYQNTVNNTEYIEVRTRSRFLGTLIILEEKQCFDKLDRSLIRNAASMLAIILENNEQEQMLENDKLRLEKEVEKQTIELRQALEKAQESAKLKEAFLSLMSHEIKTPLTGIIGFSEQALYELDLITDPDLLPLIDSFKQNIEFVKRSGLRLNEILSNLIELSAMEAGIIPQINYISFDIYQMITGIVELLKAKIDSQNDTVQISVDCEQKIYSEPSRLQHILFNLIGNAVKFTSNGRIEIRVKCEENYYKFSIKDTGIGIEKDSLNAIFNMFSQADKDVHSRQFQGAGLGLALCKKFITQLGGHIWVESKKSEGSVFYFNLPIPDSNSNEKFINN